MIYDFHIKEINTPVYIISNKRNKLHLGVITNTLANIMKQIIGLLFILSLSSCQVKPDNTWEIELVKEQVDSTLENIIFVDQLAKDTFKLKTEIHYESFEEKPYKVYYIGGDFNGPVYPISKLYIDTVNKTAFRTLDGIKGIIDIKVKR